MFKEIIKKGDKFGRLTAVKFSHRNKKYVKYWLFRCDCGVEKVICVSNVKNGGTKTCGHSKPNYKHGISKTKIYRTWCGMKQRCLNKNREKYKHYGGRGIKICDEWLNSFVNFYRDMGDCPKNKSIDRIDNDGNYCKKNCRWATSKEQNNNQRKKIAPS